MVKSFEHRTRHVLIKHIETINALSAFLDGRTVCPPTVPVVFPSQIVFTRSIHTPPRRETVVSRLPFHNRQFGGRSGTHGNLQQELAVMGQLIRHCRPVSVIHHELTSATDTEFLKYRLGLQFHHIITVVFRRILYLYFYRRRVLILHATVQITYTLTSRQQPCTGSERSLRLGIHLTGRVGLLANGLHITDAAIRLECRRNQIIPGFFNHRGILRLV